VKGAGTVDTCVPRWLLLALGALLAPESALAT
jgi:hypothetical protein